MIGALARKFFGTPNDRAVKSMAATVQQINDLEPRFVGLTDDELRQQTVLFRARLDKGETLDSLLPEAFAAVRESARRTLGQRHFDVQMMGGVVLHQGKIAEMKTGEGKTLVATLAAYLNALPGKGVHVVTVNDYLAKRDSEWMGRVFIALGMSVGCITDGEFGRDFRQKQYNADITYGTNSQFGFDYLRDNMQFRLEDIVQRPFAYAIVDEVDSILIDEARTPLIISGPSVDSSALYVQFDAAVKRLTPDCYEVDPKHKSASLTDQGSQTIDDICLEMGLMEGGSIFDIENINMLHYVTSALRANHSYRRDVDYIVKDDKVIIIDEHTGRMMADRRYGEGQHQALEAKEKVTIQRENQTLASITLQNFFRLYPKLSGMTGTAMTEAAEFEEIYKLQVVEIPTNRPVSRTDHNDEIYRSEAEKLNAVIDLIAESRELGQPVLVGTISIEKSEQVSALMKLRNIEHHVLNARYHEQEASIVAQAGRPGAITIATNMAGRGTDIKLGGNAEMMLAERLKGDEDDAARAAILEEIRAQIEVDAQKVIAAGGLCVIATERHESRRIDNQLRGRSGRQGDPGASLFFLSLEDNLMKVFGGDKIDGMLGKLGIKENEAIYHPWINKAIEKAQKRVEQHYFDARKNVLKYDDVMNDQRKVVYEQRREIMAVEDVADIVRDMRHDMIDDMVLRAIPPEAYAEQWDLDRLRQDIARLFNLDLPVHDWAREDGIADREIKQRLTDAVDSKIAKKASYYGPEIMRMVEKNLLLQTLDQIWKEHLVSMDHLREGINLRAYGQRDPLNEYKREAFVMFESMLHRLREQVTATLCHMVLHIEDLTVPVLPSVPTSGLSFGDPALLIEGSDQALTMLGQPEGETMTMVRPDPRDPTSWGAVPRNALCPCNSGKRYKACHGKIV